MTELTDPDFIFALGHVPRAKRSAVAALWGLDEQLGRVVASTTQPMVGQMRLLWWREAIVSGVEGHPLLVAMASVYASGVDPAAVQILVDGWEELLDPLPLPEAQLVIYAERRGALFALTAQICDVTCPVDAGSAWVLADFGVRCSDPVTSSRALALARDRMSGLSLLTVPRPLRILVRLAGHDLAAGRKIPRTRWQLLRSVA